MCTIHRINYCCWKPCGGKIVIMNVCFVSWGNRNNEILLPLLDLTVVRLYSLFSWNPPTIESNLLDRITFYVSDCCAVCHLVSSLTSLSSVSCLLATYLCDVSLPDTFHSLSARTGELVIVLANFFLRYLLIILEYMTPSSQWKRLTFLCCWSTEHWSLVLQYCTRPGYLLMFFSIFLCR
jgi:hypothetical protein